MKELIIIAIVAFIIAFIDSLERKASKYKDLSRLGKAATWIVLSILAYGFFMYFILGLIIL